MPCVKKQGGPLGIATSAPGLTTSNKKLLWDPGIATRNKDATQSSKKAVCFEKVAPSSKARSP